MPRHRPRLAAALLTALLALAGCQTGAYLGSVGAGASATSQQHMAAIRTANGLPAMSPDATLEKAAREQAELMAHAGQMKHTTGYGQDFVTRARRNGIDGAAAENIARGRFGLDGLFAAWMNSSGHRRNMLDKRFTRYGLASAPAGNGQRYWALVLAK